MSLAKNCHLEVLDLHAFFESWFLGMEGPATAGPVRLEAALHPEFRMVSPEGRTLDRSRVLAAVAGARGSRSSMKDVFRIRIVYMETVADSPAGCLVRYQEWHDSDRKSFGRQSLAWFLPEPEAPRGVAWYYLQETRLPNISG